MKLLLDTQAALWFLAGDGRMSSVAREAIEAFDAEVYLSDASLWEIAVKRAKGAVRLAEPFESVLTAALDRNAIRPLAIARSHILGVARLPELHEDPFDRLIISSALVEGMKVVSHEAAFDGYGIERVW